MGRGDCEDSTSVLTLDFPLILNTLDLFAAKEMIHTTNEIDSAISQKKSLDMIQQVLCCSFIFSQIAIYLIQKKGDNLKTIL